MRFPRGPKASAFQAERLARAKAQEPECVRPAGDQVGLRGGEGQPPMGWGEGPILQTHLGVMVLIRRPMKRFFQSAVRQENSVGSSTRGWWGETRPQEQKAAGPVLWGPAPHVLRGPEPPLLSRLLLRLGEVLAPSGGCTPPSPSDSIDHTGSNICAHSELHTQPQWPAGSPLQPPSCRFPELALLDLSTSPPPASP